ncbi:MAG: hypothetical protein Q7T48_07555 [Cellvibrio sp.]|uniref:hypothetical protein n=1 Tax=Cellvibrio sp. TaxID=1965322 RepID=UPI0027235D90|nr:hypothetical protein [Cellvibrio sp.]
MLISSQNPYQPNSQLLGRGVLVVGILWLLVLWNFEAKTDHLVGGAIHERIIVSADMPLHVHSEHSLTLNRVLNRAKDQSKLVESPEPIWALSSGEFIVSLPCAVANQHSLSAYFPRIHIHQLQTLNAPRAPPLV